MRNTYDEKIRAWLAENREEILQKWMDLVRIPSLQSKAEENAPYGKNCAEALKTAAGYFAARGFDVRIEAQDGYALADFGSGEKTIGLFAHCDVVPTGDGWLYTEPFTPVIRDGLLIGRGAADNKSGAMAALCIMAMAKELNLPLKSRIRTFLGTNEESGMADVEAFVRNEEMPDLSLVPDSAFPCALGEKGILRLWMQSGAALKQVLDFRGGSAFNIVLDRAEVTLAFDAALEAELREKISGNAAYTLTAEEGVLRLAAEGLAKHAADPEGSVNAAWLAASLLAGCSALCAEDRAVMAQTAVYFAAPWGESFGICHEDEHFGKLSAINGMAKVENGKLYLSLDVRYGASLPPQELEAKLHAAVESAGWQITELNNRPGYRVDPEGVVPRLMQSLYREVTGAEKDLFYMAGGTYARYLKNAYPVGRSAEVPDRAVAKATLPEGHGGVHQRDEAADLEEFFQAVRLLMHAVIACDERM